LQRTLSALGQVLATDRRTLDLVDEGAIREIVRTFRPTWIVNAAAYTAVDDAEHNESAAMWLNCDVPRILAEEVSRLDGWIVHYSTDYVFDGTASRPYREVDPTSPQSVYGRSKRAGEVAIAATGANHLLFRVAWVYGTRGRNFLQTMRRLARDRDELRVVADQIGVPTWSRQIAEATAQVVAQRPTREQAGIYHFSGSGSCSWHGFAEAVLRLEPMPETLRCTTVRPIQSAEYAVAAERPAYSVLDGTLASRMFGVQLAHWESQLELCMAGITSDPMIA
jgi:dTDP-4-dehydrorhamnose reductase